MRRSFIYAGAGAAAVFLLLLLTPAGVYVLARVAEQAAPMYGWKVEIGSSGGSLLGRPRFEEVRAGGRSGSSAITARSLAATIWEREVVVESPRIEIDLSLPDSAESTAADPAPPPAPPPEPRQFTLPLDAIPSVTVSGAELGLRHDSLQVVAKGIDLRFGTAPASTRALPSGRRLLITAPDIQLTRGATSASGSLAALFRVETDRLSADSLSVRASAGDAGVSADATGDSRLDRIPSAPLGNRIQGALSRSARRGSDHPVRRPGNPRSRDGGIGGVERFRPRQVHRDGRRPRDFPMDLSRLPSSLRQPGVRAGFASAESMPTAPATALRPAWRSPISPSAH